MPITGQIIVYLICEFLAFGGCGNASTFLDLARKK